MPKIPASTHAIEAEIANRFILSSVPLSRSLSFHHHGVVAGARLRRYLENEEQRNDGERCDQQQLVVVDICDDLCLARDHRIESCASGLGHGIPESRNGWILELPINRR